MWLDTWAILSRSVSPQRRRSLSSIMHILSHQLYVCLINICVTCTSLQAIIFYSHMAMNNLSETTTTSYKLHAIHCISLCKQWPKAWWCDPTSYWGLWAMEGSQWEHLTVKPVSNHWWICYVPLRPGASWADSVSDGLLIILTSKEQALMSECVTVGDRVFPWHASACGQVCCCEWAIGVRFLPVWEFRSHLD